MSTHAHDSLLSVIVPMYQSGPTVSQTIESILADHVDGGLEVIVVNDGSTDNGPAIVESFARTDPRLRMISQPNAGLAAARNTGINAARGQWLRFIDADDWIAPGSCQRLINHAIRQNLPAACAAQELVDECGLSLDRISPALGGPDGTIGIEHFLDSNRCGVGTVVLSAAALGDDRFDPSLRVCEDWDLWLRLALRGVRFAVCPQGSEPVLSYRVRQASLSKDFAGMLRIGQAALARAYENARRLHPAGLDCSAERESIAMHRTALQWATMCAVSDRRERLEEAMEMFAHSGGGVFMASEAAAAAISAALVGLGIRPEAENNASTRWLQRTDHWWRACAARGWMQSAHIEPARRMLAEMAVLPMAIARACVDDARPLGQSTLTVIGAGENGRLIARAAAEAGIPLSLRDDRLDDGRLQSADLPASARTEPMSAPLDAGSIVVLSAADDASLFKRFHASSPIRWNDVRRRLSQAILDRARRITDSSPPSPPSPAFSPAPLGRGR